MLKKILFFLISLAAGIALLIGVISSVGWQELKSSFAIFTGWQGLVILLVTFLILLLGAWKWKIILGGQGYHLPMKEILRLFMSGFSLSYFFPIFMGAGTGTILRGYVLREKYLIPWRRGAASLIIERFLDVTLGLLVVLAGFLFFLFKMGPPSDNSGILLLSGLIVFTAFVAFLYFKFLKSESILGFFAKFFNKRTFAKGAIQDIEQDLFDFFKPGNALFWKVAGLTLLKMVLFGVRCWLLLLFLGEFLALSHILLILAFYFLAASVPVPAMLGTHELSQAFAFGILGVETGLAPAFTMMQRMAEVFLALVGFLILFKLGIDLFKTVFPKKAGPFLR